MEEKYCQACGMQQNKTAREMSVEMRNRIIEYFGDRATAFCRSEISDEGNKSFFIDFKIYRYFHLLITNKDDNLGCAIIVDENYNISLDTSQTKYSTADFEVFFKEIEKQLELRIPDKFLEYYNRKGWKIE